MSTSVLRPRKNINYRDLNEGNIVTVKESKIYSRRVLNDKDYFVERLIWKKTIGKDDYFLVKWKDYHVYDTTWEPEIHIPRYQVAQYSSPTIENYRKVAFAQAIERSVQCRLRSKNPRSVVYVELDVYRSCFGESSKLCSLEDFSCLNMTEDWYYTLRSDGSGIQLKFPVRVTPTLHERDVFVRENGQLLKKRRPIERCTIYSSVEACSLE